MRHNQKKHTLVSKKGGSNLVVRNLVTSLFMFDKVCTTRSRAKALSMAVDRLISYVKKHPDYNAIRKLQSFVFTEEASRKVMEVLKQRYENRSSGFTSLQRIGYRKGDGSEIFQVKLLSD